MNLDVAIGAPAAMDPTLRLAGKKLLDGATLDFAFRRGLRESLDGLRTDADAAEADDDGEEPPQDFPLPRW